MDNLARDAKAALKAGMSYGRWKAMQEPVVKEKKGIPDGYCVCVGCGKQFIPTTKRQKYCDLVCMQRTVNGRYKKRKKERSSYGKAENGLDEQTVHTEQ